VLTTKDGIQHRFGYNTDSKMIGLAVDLRTAITWRYFLDEVKTTSGVSMRYAYVKRTATAKGTHNTYDQAVYLDTITYAYKNGALVGPARTVQYLRASRTDWTDRTSTDFISVFEKERLASIEVRVGGALATKYVLNVDYSIDRDPTYKWGGGATGDLTLKSVSIIGSDGVSTLPSPNFTYTGAILTTANNGIGGSVNYTYEAIKNLYLVQQDTDTGCGTVWLLLPYVGGAPCTVQVQGYILKDPAPNTVPLYAVQVMNGEACGAWIISYQPGDCGGKIFGYLWTTNTSDSIPIYLIRNESDGSCSPGWVVSYTTAGACASKLLGYAHAGAIDYSRDYEILDDRYRSRVVSRTANDGLGWSSTTTFLGYNPAFGLDIDFKQEFRGFAKVHSTDPLGNYTDNLFHQDDAKKGRPYQIEVRSSTGDLFSEVVNTWTTSNPFTYVTWVSLTRTDKYKCDGQQTCLQTAQTFTYDTSGNPTQTVSLGDVSINGDERTEATDWSIDSTNWIHRPNHVTLKDPGGAVVRERWLTYDTLGRLTQKEDRLLGAQGTPGNPVVTYGYDSYGNKTTATDPLGCSTTTTYETSQTYPDTATTCLGHDIHFLYDPKFGVITSQTDPNGQAITSIYDTFGRLTKITGPLDTASPYGTESRAYLDWGNPALQRIEIYKTIDHGTANVIVSKQFFDGLGRFDHTETDGPNGQTIATDTDFDVRGQVSAKSAPYSLSIENPTPLLTYFGYDVLGRQAQVTHPDQTFATRNYVRDMITETDENSHVKRKYFDAYDRLRRVEEVNGTETYVTTYEYDVAGSLTRVTDHLGHVTTMSYDFMGRKTAMSDPNMGNWSYSYDAAGNLISQTDAKSQTLTFDYDLQSRMRHKTYPDSRQITWTYDDPAVSYSKGRLTKVTDLSTVTCFTYNQVGQVTQSKRTLGGTVCDSSSYTMSQTYNGLNSITSETFPDGDMVTYSYDKGFLNIVHDATLNYDYVTSTAYNARGQKTSVQYGNGVTSNFQYNDTGPLPNFRLHNRATSGSGGNFQNLTYGYDNVGNVTSIDDPLFTADRSFTYDALNRLLTASGTFGAPVGGIPGSANCAYAYDAIGNIVNKCGVTYSYGDPNHPSFVTSTSDGKSYTPDANGNTLSGAGRTFTWTVDNRVASVDNGSGAINMDYDYTGMRLKKNGPLGITLYPFSGYEIGPDGVIIKYFKAGNDILAAKKSTGEKLFYHNDHLGGINVITNAGGTRAQLVEYDPWGKVTRSEGDADPRHRFTGQELDLESGLYYYGGRYYDQEISKFLSADPIVQAPANPQNLNRYTYVINNPQTLVDPSGHMFFWFLGVMISAVVNQTTHSDIGTAISSPIGYLIGKIAGPKAAAGMQIFGGIAMMLSGNPAMATAGFLYAASGAMQLSNCAACKMAAGFVSFAGSLAGGGSAGGGSPGGGGGGGEGGGDFPGEWPGSAGTGGPPRTYPCTRCQRPEIAPLDQYGNPISPYLTYSGILGGGEYISSDYYQSRNIGSTPHGGIDIVKENLQWRDPIFSPCNCKILSRFPGGFYLRSGNVNIQFYHAQLTSNELTVTVGQEIGNLFPAGEFTGPNLHVQVEQANKVFNPHFVFMK
jgi:RHS repeat-associated protein